MAMKPIKKAASAGEVWSLSCSYQGIDNPMDSNIQAVEIKTVKMNFQRIVM
jgi:hypothetical protein